MQCNSFHGLSSGKKGGRGSDDEDDEDLDDLSDMSNDDDLGRLKKNNTHI